MMLLDASALKLIEHEPADVLEIATMRSRWLAGSAAVLRRWPRPN